MIFDTISKNCSVEYGSNKSRKPREKDHEDDDKMVIDYPLLW